MMKWNEEVSIQNVVTQFYFVGTKFEESNSFQN